MNNAKAFSSVLSKIRKEQGFSSAHQFFKSVGGSKSLGLSFMSYWDMERGKKLPKSWRLKAIMASLGIAQYSPKAQELVRAYFKALSGSDELLHTLSAPASAGVDLPSRDLAEAATHKALSQLSVHLTLEQWKLRTRDMVTHICQSYLADTAGWVTVREMSDATKFKPEAIRKALKALASGGLVDFSKDKARGRFTGKIIQLLPWTPATAAIRVALRNNWNMWLADSSLAAMKRQTVRMTKANLNIYRQHLEKAVNLAAVYGNAEENREDSAIYLIDASIFQIIPRH
ncbi:MAG: hypothetical protein NTX59_00465 [Elusimicrobia bacterium]|nr:hypothetical protein [Elusimicrobiota bacterium]